MAELVRYARGSLMNRSLACLTRFKPSKQSSSVAIKSMAQNKTHSDGHINILISSAHFLSCPSNSDLIWALSAFIISNKEIVNLSYFSLNMA